MARKTREAMIAELRAAISAGQIWNVDFKEISDDANRSFYDEMSAARAALWVPSPQHRGDEPAPDQYGAIAVDDKRRLPSSVLHLPGYLKRCPRVREDWPFFNRRVDLAERWAEVANLLIEARPLIVKGRKPRAPEDRPQRSDNECSCCERQIELVKRATDQADVIAHHGYERSGQGWQTESCPGARWKAYHTEEGRDRLAWWVDVLSSAVDRKAKRLEAVKAAKVLTITREKRGPDGRVLYHTVTKTRRNWGSYETKEPVKEDVEITPQDGDWTRQHGLAVATAERDLRMSTEHRDRCKDRLKAWKLRP